MVTKRKKQRKTSRLTIRLSEEARRLLEQKAQEDDRTPSDYARLLITRAVAGDAA